MALTPLTPLTPLPPLGIWVCSLLGAGSLQVPRSTVLRGTVVAEIGETPIAGAVVSLRRAQLATTTDRLGRFALRAAAGVDTLTVAAIGWSPASIAVRPQGSSPLRIGLYRRPVVVSDLIVRADQPGSLELSDQGKWRMPLAVARSIPPAIETDVYRSLALVPAVSFTSPLSARPLIRGYDAQEVTTRIDGFEVLNLFHLGRLFSSFPAEAAHEIAVSPPPYTASHGGTVAGLIDVTGRTGPATGLEGGGGASFGSFSAHLGGGNERARFFGAARAFHAKLLEVVPGIDIPYHFEDLYGSAVLGPPDRPRARVTLFATQDRAGASAGSRLVWDNLVLGARWRVVDRGRSTLDFSVAAARFREDGIEIPSMHFGPADFRNRFARLMANGDLVVLFHRARFGLGAQLGARRVANTIGPAHDSEPAGPPFPIADTRFARGDLAGYAELSRQFGRWTASGAVRADLTGRMVSVQPRIHLRWAPGSRTALGARLGRTSRSYHLLADPRSEPELDFLDFWVDAGRGVPIARVDHAAFDVDLGMGPVVARLSGFVSRGSGIGELRPETDQRPGRSPFFRFGRSRTGGFEAQIAYRGTERAPHALSASYGYSISERNWGAGWVRWSQDRRHQLRLFGQIRTARLALFGALEAATGMPLTPYAHWFHVGPSSLPAEVVPANEEARAVFGQENSAGTSGTFRVDGGLSHDFSGPGRSRLTLGLSVINLLFGEVSPIGTLGEGPPARDRSGRPTPYRRAFELPAIPSVTLRIEFGGEGR